jgi:hypothetical protein
MEMKLTFAAVAIVANVGLKPDLILISMFGQIAWPSIALDLPAKFGENLVGRPPVRTND